MMNPKMTSKDAAGILRCSEREVVNQLRAMQLPFTKTPTVSYFGFEAARALFAFEFNPQAIAFQIVKGGTGKTSIAHEVAIRANLYGAKVLCVDMDQQGNLTQSFGMDVESTPVMVDILAEGYDYQDAIVSVQPGLDIIGSRIENAIIDDVITLKRFALDRVYREPFKKLKEVYDLIVVDCPPNLGQSVAAITLASDCVIAPVAPEKFALSGLDITNHALEEMQENYGHTIDFRVLVNKFDGRTRLSQEAKRALTSHAKYNDLMLETYVRATQDFPNAVGRLESVYDSLKPGMAKQDIDALTQEILGIEPQATDAQPLNALSKIEQDMKNLLMA